MTTDDCPDVSVVIVSFNTRDLLQECLATLQAHAGAVRYETLVIDNASKDGSADAIAQAFPTVKLIRSAVNLGFGNANNLGFAQARGRYVVLLNSDAFLYPDALPKAVEYMDRDSRIGLGGARLVSQDGSWQPSARLFPSLLNEFLNLSGLAARFPNNRVCGRFDRTWADPNMSALVDWVPGAFSIVRREVLESVGYFDPRYFLYYEEVDLCRRIKAAGYTLWYWPDVVVEHRGGESSKTVSHLTLSGAGTQLSLWRMRSEWLYYRQWHGGFGAWGAMALEKYWHLLRAAKNRRSNPVKTEESQALVRLLRQSWRETQGGRVSPPQPW
ncbi:MAG: glycosyltransferase family 2 protein [Candidatus Competibacteraceae bacterium]|nr:glycosyltransferase family 2 protein [Candidatus Competibacteraceae bacterium]